MFKAMGYSPGLLLESGRFSTLRIHPKSTQTVVQAVTNHFRMVLEAIQRVWSDFQDLSKSAMFKTMAIAQAVCSKSANFQPLRIHPKSTQTVAQAVTNYFRTVLERFQRVWSDFQDLPKSTMFKAMGYSPGLLLESGRFSTLRIHPKSTQTVVQAVTNHFRMVLEAIQRVWSDFQDLSKSAMFKTMAIAQAVFSKSANFQPLRIHPKSTQTVAQAVTNYFRTVLEAFQRVWSDFQDLPISAMFKTMGYCPGRLLEIGQFSTSTNSP